MCFFFLWINKDYYYFLIIISAFSSSPSSYSDPIKRKKIGPGFLETQKILYYHKSIIRKSN